MDAWLTAREHPPSNPLYAVILGELAREPRHGRNGEGRQPWPSFPSQVGITDRLAALRLDVPAHYDDVGYKTRTVLHSNHPEHHTIRSRLGTPILAWLYAAWTW